MNGQEKKSSKMNIGEILSRIKHAEDLKNDKDIAKLLGLSSTNFSNRKKRGTLISPIVDWAIHHQYSLDWLLTGKGDKHGHAPQADREGTRGKEPEDAIELIMQLTETVDEWIREGLVKSGVKKKMIKRLYEFVKVRKGGEGSQEGKFSNINLKDTGDLQIGYNNKIERK